MSFQAVLLIISNILVFLAYTLYIISILRGKAKPHRTTRFVLLLITALATFSLLAQNNHVAVWLAGISGIMSFLVFILTLKYGMGGWSIIDIVCLMIAVLGIAVWKITNNPVLALFSAILADFTGIVPTLIKTYHHPQTEEWKFFGVGVLGTLLNLLAIASWRLEEYAYPMYLLLIDSFIIFLIFRKNIANWLKNYLS